MDLFNAATAQLVSSEGKLTSITLKTLPAQPPAPAYIYDGSLLPLVPASTLQVFVSWLYATFVFVVMGMGALAVSAQQKLDLDSPPNIFMQRLLWKRHALGLGILAFIPATFSMVHLFTSSLHNFSIYNATNIVFVAVLSYGAKYLSEAMQQCMDESAHMDTYKAVYESLYMCANRAQRVLGCESFPELGRLKPLLTKAKTTDTPHVQQEVFAAPALQDKRHYWGHRNGCVMWLFSQDKSVRTYTGCTVAMHRVHQALNTASFTAQDLCAHANGFLTMLAGRMATLLLVLSSSYSLKAHEVSCGTKKLKLGLLLEVLLKINYSRHALDIMCERYICRRTPGVAADSDADSMVDVLRACAKELFLTQAAVEPFKFPDDLPGEECCTVWLAYMHLVLLGVDLLRAHINQPVLAAQAAAHGTYEAGFFSGIMGLDGMAEAAAAKDTADASAASQAQKAAIMLDQATAAAQTASRRADVVQRYVQLADLCQQQAEDAARKAQTAADASKVAGAARAAGHSQEAAQAARIAKAAADRAAALTAQAVSAVSANIPPAARVVSQDGVGTLNALAAVSTGVIAGPIAAAAYDAAAAAAADTARAKAASSCAHTASISAAVEVARTRVAQETIRELLSSLGKASHPAVAEAAADELLLAAGQSAATSLVYGAAAGNAKLAKAAAKAAAEGAPAASITAAVASMFTQDVSALRYENIYALTDMELCGFAAALATLLLTMEQPHLVGSEAAAASPQAAADIAATLTQAKAAAAPPAAPPPAPTQGTSNMNRAGFIWDSDNGHADATVLKSRADLVESHASIPMFLEGVLCLSPADSMHGMQVSLAFVLMLMAFGAVAISTLVCRDGVTLASAAGLWQSGLVAMMFVLLHCVPKAPNESMCMHFWLGLIAPLLWVFFFTVYLYRELTGQNSAASKTAQEGLEGTQDKKLKQALNSSWLGQLWDMLGMIAISAACGGFCFCLYTAVSGEQDCAPGALEPGAGSTPRVYASSILLNWT